MTTVTREDLWRQQAADMPERTVKRNGVRVEGLQAKVEGRLKFYGWKLAYHTWRSDHSAAGFPDIIAIKGPGTHVGLAIELKAQGKNPTPTQEDWLNAFGNAGFKVYVWHPIDLLNGEIDEVLARAYG